ncbi:thioredoxin-like protein [Frondihabitans sp. PhB188]|uniref:DsbA family protein n=1 Tax=Frondihabitans sp. PhB188 TaxID=2485200 RepID=UPI000FB10A00|nr:thioredoxin domain-containing protein [Frondihabitans sp. PhB188]ROQ37559.1 thioredoxin-like protein [Frondihabitans sp. PhB188]
MTDNDNGSPSGSGRPSRGDRRQVAREKARLARARQKARARRGRWALIAGVAVVVVALIVGVGYAVVSSVPDAATNPRNMAGNGITIGKGLKLVSGDSTTTSASADPTSTATAGSADTVKISIYLDYLCPVCGGFEKANNDYIKGLVQSGAATVEYHPIAILTNSSLGTKYSQRAAASAACVATYSPDSFFDFNTAMFDRQPEEQTAGLTNAQLVTLIKGVSGITDTDKIQKCVTDQTYAPWVLTATQQALTGPLDGTDVKKVAGTPTVLVNGQQYKYTTPFTNEEFSNFIVTAAGNSYTDTATATPTPTPTPTPTKSSKKK